MSDMLVEQGVITAIKGLIGQAEAFLWQYGGYHTDRKRVKKKNHWQKCRSIFMLNEPKKIVI